MRARPDRPDHPKRRGSFLRGWLSEEIVRVADGATGTQLLARGLPPPPESWNIARYAMVQEIARRYLEAGAEIVTTNTLGATPLRLASLDLSGELKEVVRAGIAAARMAVVEQWTRGKRAGQVQFIPRFVFGSCGPSGRRLGPGGDVTPEELRESFLAAMRLHAGSVDAIAVETMTDLREAVIAVDAAREAADGETPVMATMAFPRGGPPFRAAGGEDVRTICDALSAAGAEVLGANCAPSIEEMVALAREFRAATDLPLYFRPSAGLPERRGSALVHPLSPEAFAAKSLELRDAGVRILGGCCGTTPEHVRLLARTLRAS
ncbi:MAG: homocysteine S-methyltransferase family protein [Candidatus Eisenbacteria bacterium]|nr:homocysteine S-methyltransferase family protein [Candidatus Eisenbacteria bacterium]